MEYSVNELAKLAGVTPRTLRHYDKIGLLVPDRQGTGDYRKYKKKEVDRLQDILLYRELGMELSQIKEILNDKDMNREESLVRHLDKLTERKLNLDILIENVKNTIRAEKGEITMTDDKKFEGLKKKIIEDNEKTFGEEVRQNWGDEVADESNRKMMNLTKEQFKEFKEMGIEIKERLEQAVNKGIDPKGDEGLEIGRLHRKWLGFTWPEYSYEAHTGLVEMYVSDERFTSYYDDNVKGCAKFLKDAVNNMVKVDN